MTVELTITEVFALGMAYGAFSYGDIDAGIHEVLPVRDPETDKWDNIVFQGLIDHDFYNIDYPEGWDKEEPYHYDLSSEDLGQLYMDAIDAWAKRHSIEIGRSGRPAELGG